MDPKRAAAALKDRVERIAGNAYRVVKEMRDTRTMRWRAIRGVNHSGTVLEFGEFDDVRCSQASFSDLESAQM